MSSDALRQQIVYQGYHPKDSFELHLSFGKKYMMIPNKFRNVYAKLAKACKTPQ